MQLTLATTITSRRVSSADGRRVAQPVDLVVDRAVLLDVGVAGGDVGLGLVVVVVADEVLDPVVGEELLELGGQLGGEALVRGQDQRRALHLLDRPGDGGALAAAGDAQQRLEAVAPIDARRRAARWPWAGRPQAGSPRRPGTPARLPAYPGERMFVAPGPGPGPSQLGALSRKSCRCEHISALSGRSSPATVGGRAMAAWKSCRCEQTPDSSGRRSLGCDSDNDVEEAIGFLEVVPTDVQHLPTLGGQSEVAALVGGLATLTLVVRPAVGLDAELDRRERRIEPPDEAASPISDDVLPVQGRQLDPTPGSARPAVRTTSPGPEPPRRPDPGGRAASLSPADPAGATASAVRRIHAVLSRLRRASSSACSTRSDSHTEPRSDSVRAMPVVAMPRTHVRSFVASACTSWTTTPGSLGWRGATTETSRSSPLPKPSRPWRRAAARCEATAPPAESVATIEALLERRRSSRQDEHTRPGLGEQARGEPRAHHPAVDAQLLELATGDRPVLERGQAHGSGPPVGERCAARSHRKDVCAGSPGSEARPRFPSKSCRCEQLPAPSGRTSPTGAGGLGAAGRRPGSGGRVGAGWRLGRVGGGAGRRQGLEPGPEPVDLVEQVGPRAGVVDHPVGLGAPLLPAGLAGHAGDGRRPRSCPDGARGDPQRRRAGRRRPRRPPSPGGPSPPAAARPARRPGRCRARGRCGGRSPARPPGARARSGPSGRRGR